MPERLRLLEHWLEHECEFAGYTIAPASADASFRRYFRVTLPDGQTRIAMDAPPDKEDCGPFLRVRQLLESADLHVPAVYAADLGQGFLLLEVLGDQPYLPALNEASVDGLYRDAMRALLAMQRKADARDLPAYDRAMLLREMRLFPEWLLKEHLGLSLSAAESTMLDETFEGLVVSALEQPAVCVHRDYHSRNLMVTSSRNPGVIDFQDAVRGPITYDLVSLLRDCYVAWPRDRVDAWVGDYHVRLLEAGLLEGVSFETFVRWFDLMGVQRHLKAAGIFARLLHRDGKTGYMADVPRTLGYICAVAERESSVRPLSDFIAAKVLSRL